MQSHDSIAIYETQLKTLRHDTHQFEADAKLVLSLDRIRVEAALKCVLRSSLDVDNNAVTSISELEEATSTGLEHVCHFFRLAQDIKSRHETIQQALDSMSTENQQSLEAATDQIKEHRRQKQQIQSALTQEVGEVGTLNDKKEHNHDKRKALRFGRAVAWGATMAFPVMVPIAAGMEIGAHKLRKKARTLDSERTSHSLKITQLEEEIKSFGQSIPYLRSRIMLLQKLLGQCDALSVDIKAGVSEVQEKLKSFLDLKLAYSAFYQHNKDWKVDAELLQRYGAGTLSIKSLKRAILKSMSECHKEQLLQKVLGSSSSLGEVSCLKMLYGSEEESLLEKSVVSLYEVECEED